MALALEAIIGCASQPQLAEALPPCEVANCERVGIALKMLLLLLHLQLLQILSTRNLHHRSKKEDYPTIPGSTPIK
jgi:hypothetical protein